MGYEAAGRKIDELLEQLDEENLSEKAKKLKKKVKEIVD